MGLREILEELESPPPECELIDLDKLLLECGYTPRVFEELDTVVYFHEGWDSRLTFPLSKRTIPGTRLAEILEFVRWRLEQEGRL